MGIFCDTEYIDLVASVGLYLPSDSVVWLQRDYQPTMAGELRIRFVLHFPTPYSSRGHVNVSCSSKDMKQMERGVVAR